MTVPTATVDSWTLRTMREAKAYRDSIGEPDAYWDARLAAAEAALCVEVTEVPDAGQAPRGGGSGMSNYGASRHAPTDGQLRFIAALSRDLGRELDTPRDKYDASRIIDAAKRELSARPAAARPVRPASEAQCAYLRSLVAERLTPVDPANADRITPATTGAKLASQLIETFTAAPRRATPATTHGIREGRYAYQPADGAASFYRVTRTGRIRVQAGPAEHPYNGQLNEALRWIAANQRAAAALYGQLIGCCGRCGRELTDETSRAQGLGPDCAKKSDW